MHHDRLDNPEIAHEATDVNVRGILLFLLGLTVTGVVIHLAIWLLFQLFAGWHPAGEPVASSLEGRPQIQRLPPEPRLQANPSEDLKALLREEDAILNGYGWVDRHAGTVRIPIAQAMKILAERGLPARPMVPAPSPRAGQPADSSSGRTVEREP